MPIQVPGYGSSEGGGKQPRMSDAGVKPWLALAELGQKGLRAAKALDDHNKRIQQIEDDADLAEFKNRAQSLYADRKLSFVEDHDYSSYKEKWEGDLNQLSAELNDSDMTEDARNKASLFLQNFSGGSRIGVAQMVQEKSVQRAKQAFVNQTQFIQDNFDVNAPEGGRAAMYDAVQSASFLTPEEKEDALNQFERFASNQVESSTIMEDPGKWLENNSEPSGNLTDWKRKTNLAKAALAERQTSQADDVLNFLYSGNNISPEDIEEMTPDLDAKARQKLADAIDDYNSRGTKNRILTDPAFYNQIVGEITSGISSYKPGVDGFTDGYVELRSKIDSLPTSAAKTEFTKQLNDKRNQREKDIKTTKDWAFGLLEEAYEDGQFGNLEVDKPEGKPLFQYLDEGLLRDEQLLQDLGFSEDIASSIVTNENLGTSTGRNKAIDILRRNWSSSNKRVEGFPADKFEIFESLRSESLSFKFVPKKELEAFEARGLTTKQKASEAYGNAVKEIVDLFELKPDASQEEVNKRLGELNINARATSSQWIPKFEYNDSGVLPPLEE